MWTSLVKTGAFPSAETHHIRLFSRHKECEWMADLSMLLIWLCKAKKDTGDSMASLLLAQSLTTFSPVLSIFSVSWSTAMLLGAHTSTGLQMYAQAKHHRHDTFQLRLYGTEDFCQCYVVIIIKIWMTLHCTHFLVGKDGRRWSQRWPSFQFQEDLGSDSEASAVLFSQRKPTRNIKTN